MLEFMNITKALADQNRVRVLMVLKGRELCVCQLIELLGLAPSTVSKHMSILKNARLVESRKDGLWMHYSLPKSPATEVRKAIDWLCSSLKDDEKIRDDRKQLRMILKMNLEDICKKQNGRTSCKTKRTTGNDK